MKTVDFRLALAAVVLFITAVQETSFPTGYLLFAAFSLIIVLIVRLVLRNRGKSEANPNEEPSFDTKRQEPAQSERLAEKYGEELNGGYVKSKSFSDYPNITDPWDIKDDKPPWEL